MKQNIAVSNNLRFLKTIVVTNTLRQEGLKFLISCAQFLELERHEYFDFWSQKILTINNFSKNYFQQPKLFSLEIPEHIRKMFAFLDLKHLNKKQKFDQLNI